MSIEIIRPWARVQTVESRQAGGFMTLKNSGPEADRLLAASSAVAETVEIHGIRVVENALRMRPYKQGLNVPVGMPIELKPRGYHLFMQGLKAPLAKGQKVPVTLTFEKAGPRQVELTVEDEGLVGKDTLGLYVPKDDETDEQVSAREATLAAKAAQREK
jgi:periplasmic copper chaperone A